MFRKTRQGSRLLELREAFKRDGYEIRKIVKEFNRLGIMAESRSAFNYDTRERKKVYYLEGNHYEMGYLLGLLAEKDIDAMCNDFAKKAIFAFIGSKLENKVTFLHNFLMKIIYSLSKKTYNDIPGQIRDEIKGIYDGCRKANPKTRVSLEQLIVLNLGIDVLCSGIYSGDFVYRAMEYAEADVDMKPEDFDIPIMCNAFSVSGESAGYGHYFGRDFMFPTAGVFQDKATMIVYNPVTENGSAKANPLVSVTAPGIVGSISAMNNHGVAMGVDMVPGGNCSPNRIGTNSLLLVRICVEGGDSAEEAVRIMQNTERGVSWNYIIADGTTDRACVAETGSSSLQTEPTEYPDERYKDCLPDAAFVRDHMSSDLVKGMMVRWNDYKYPDGYLSFNDCLWKRYNELNPKEAVPLPAPDAFDRKGFIVKDFARKSCPSVFYFPPLRADNGDIVVLTNHYIIPEMRLCTMKPWTAMISGRKSDDIQWRYDELNFQLQEALEKKGYIDFETAREIIDFLSPKRMYPGYYSKNKKSKDGKGIQIHGCVSVFDLKKKYVESHYGYYCDKWVGITLENYINNDDY